MIPAIALFVATAPLFSDVTTPLGLSLGNDEACWIDVDQDGWTDLIAGGTVWRNERGSGFRKLQEGVGSVVAADFDNDGFADLFSWSQHKLWHNEAGKKFVETPLPSLPESSSHGACWGDFDNDGYVDLFVGGYEDWNRQITFPSYILMNKKGKGFELRWSDSTYRSRGVTACDFNRDGAIDVYVSNYRLQPNELFLNDGHGGFKNVAVETNSVATSPGFDGGHSIGAAWGDFDNDGQFDLFAGNFAHVDDRGDQPKSRFLRNVGGKFQDMGPCGVWYQESYASPAAGDVDNDGNLDLFFTTVYGVASFGKPNYPVLYRNEGLFKFEDVTAGSGLEKLPPTGQAAFADFRNDGRLSLCTGGKLFENRGTSGHWLEIRLEGDGRTVNRSAIGAQVRVFLRGRMLSRQVEAGTGEGNQNDLKLHFGLGAVSGRVTFEVSWPGVAKPRRYHAVVDRIVDTRYRG